MMCKPNEQKGLGTHTSVCVWCGGGAGRSGHHLELLQDHVVHGKVGGLAESSAAKVLLIRVPQALDQVVLCAFG